MEFVEHRRDSFADETSSILGEFLRYATQLYTMESEPPLVSERIARIPGETAGRMNKDIIERWRLG
jgi:hypothetical protein